MCKSLENCDLALRFKARFGVFERSGITLAVVWRSQVHGTRRRRAVNRGLHIFATFFQCFFAAKVANRSYNNKIVLKNKWRILVVKEAQATNVYFSLEKLIKV